ncbi:glycoside hydrolase family 3 N-terminal domain-containing protein, partial [Mesorhizobium sp.]
GMEPNAVIELGRASAEGLMSGGVLPVMKHIPGHGRAFADTHFALPTVDTPLAELRQHDFAPFKALNHLPMAMTAHVVYSAIDPDNPATTSAKVVNEVIRGEIGFDGLLMSDDTSMKALSGDFPTKAAAILAAGCDLVLHCNGVFEEMSGIASRTTVLEGKSLARAERALAYIKDRDVADESTIRAEFATYFDAVA